MVMAISVLKIYLVVVRPLTANPQASEVARTKGQEQAEAANQRAAASVVTRPTTVEKKILRTTSKVKWQLLVEPSWNGILRLRVQLFNFPGWKTSYRFVNKCSTRHP
jgi:hypothetical protein